MFTLSFVHASDTNASDILVADNDTSVLTAPVIPDTPDKPDLVVNDTIYVNEYNIDEYFRDNVLSSEFNDKTFVFEGDFNNLAKLSIKASNVTIKGDGAVLKNTVFDVSGDNVTLANLKFDLDSDLSYNDGAAIIFDGDGLIFDNLDIDYIAEVNREAYAFYGVGNLAHSRNLRITNSRINFEGHNNNRNVYNCAIKVINYDYALMENNTITTSLPLKDVNHGVHGTTLDSDFVVSVGVENCNYLKFINNTVISEVNFRQDSPHPTLDGLLISKCDNSLIENNTIMMSDFITYPGLDNYLYGIDIYNLNNLTVRGNDISIITTGGRLAAGTAYPIQISGPISGVNITRNSLYSFSNGPNIGIYSQNYYGGTELSITYNRINVTGLAGTHEWALVAGVETQDSNSVVENNIIEVHSVGAVGTDDNIYGVSYRQSTAGDHRYSIQNNTVFSDGFKSVYLLSSNDSTVSNNLLVSYNENARNGYDGFGYGSIANHNGINFQNNQVIRAFDYYANIYNNNVNDENGRYTYTNPTNTRHVSNVIDGRSINPISNERRTYNPIIPGSSENHGTYSEGELLPANANHQDNSNSQNTGEGSFNGKRNSNVPGSNSNANTNNVNGASSYAMSNSTDATPSDIGVNSLVGEAVSSGGSSSVAKKAFEIEDINKNEFIPSIFYVIATLILLIVGYRRKNSNSD
ncbi:right-handed parallel beta-helix repeat-containing protein [Methanobrevibacter sp.]